MIDVKNIPQDLYNDILLTMPISCVDVVIVHNGQFLLVRRKDEPAKGKWWLPGGRVHKGELLKDCAKRKALDEVGINCYVGPIVHTEETMFETGVNGIPTHSINVCYMLTPKYNTEVELDDHSVNYEWYDWVDESWSDYVKKCLKGAGFV